MAKQWHQLEHLDHKALKKLQQDREKQALLLQKEEERKRYFIIAGAIVFAVSVVLIFIYVLNKRADQKAFAEARALLLKSTVINTAGTTFLRSFGDWEPLKKGFVFDKEYSFKAEKESNVTVEMQLKNLVKLASNSEMVVFPPVLDEKENKVKGENVKVTRGEVTVSVGVDGRETLEVEAGGVVALGASGLFKVIYNNIKSSGEVVVKNGLVEVYTRANPAKKVKVSGFYKVVFSKAQFNSPTQASIIQYDWR